MKAVVLTKGGDPAVLIHRDVPDPKAGAGQVRVRLHAAGLNHRDLYLRRSHPGPAPLIMGSDGAGVVDAVGAGVDPAWQGRPVVISPSLNWGDSEEAFAPGFEILGQPSPGTYAEMVVVPVENIASKPEHLDYLQTAAFPLAGLTAWRGLFTQGRLKPGQTVLLPGIGGGVAGMALLLAKAAGVRVIVTSSSEAKLASALSQGADIAINYTAERWEDDVRDAAGSDGIDMVLDHSGAQTLPAATRLVRPGGRVVFLGATTGADLKLDVRELFRRQTHLIGTYMGSPREFAALFRFIRQNHIVPELQHVYPLADAAQAHALMEAGGQYGKIILDIAG